jgi:uncharacterized protein YjbI with pentapeptide repeats
MAEEEFRVVQANEIVLKVENGLPINYSHIKINGNLDLSANNTVNERHIYTPIKITDSILSGYIYLNNTIFNSSIDFYSVRFIGPAAFVGTHFNGPTNFDNSQFNNNAVFAGSIFNGPTSFLYTKFAKSANFLGANFRGETEFIYSVFYGISNFKTAVFADMVYFDGVLFNRSVSFREAKFDRASFYGTQFKEDVDFDSAKFNEFGDFSLAKFEKKIYFNHVNFARILINWENIKDKFISDGPTYFAMIKNFKDIEQYVDADSCYYQYRDIKRKSEPMGNSKILDYMAWLSCGYGVRWLNTIITAIMILMLFGVYYESYYVIGLIRNYIFSKNIKVVDYYDIKIKLLNSFYFSIVMLLSLPSEWFPSGKDEFSKLLRRHMFSAVLERLIGWGLMLLLIGTLSRLMIRY